MDHFDPSDLPLFIMKEYICENCDHPCILRVECGEGFLEPDRCPFDTYNSVQASWKLNF